MASIKMDGLPVRILNANNYALWSIDVCSALALKGWDTALTNERDGDSKEALAVIVLLVDDTEKINVAACHSAKAAWDMLRAKYKTTAKAHCLELKQQLDRFTMLPGETLDQAAKRVKDIRAQLAAAGIDRTEEDAVQAFMVGLPKDVSHVPACGAANADRRQEAHLQ